MSNIQNIESRKRSITLLVQKSFHVIWDIAISTKSSFRSTAYIGSNRIFYDEQLRIVCCFHNDHDTCFVRQLRIQKKFCELIVKVFIFFVAKSIWEQQTSEVSIINYQADNFLMGTVVIIGKSYISPVLSFSSLPSKIRDSLSAKIFVFPSSWSKDLADSVRTVCILEKGYIPTVLISFN